MTEIEQHFQHLLDLLNQADQDVREVKVVNKVFGEAHHLNNAHGHTLDDAIRAIEKVLGEATSYHNEATARLREAQAHAASLEDEGAESASSA